MEPNRDVMEIVDDALAGKPLKVGQIARLCAVREFTLDAHYIDWAARQMTSDASEGIAEVHAQVGMDANPCSKNCEFCSFAACNTARTGKMEMPKEQVVASCRAYAKQGANCLTLMITADYDFNRYLDIVSAVHSAVPEMPITANMGDFDEAMAGELKSAGITSVYHAVRMGEGIINDIPIEVRYATIDAAHAVGLPVMSCLEMIDPCWEDTEVAQNMVRMLAHHTEYVNAWGMIAVPGTKSFDQPHYTYPKYRLYSNVMRLAAGRGVRFGDGNLSWAEVGTNPRDDSNQTEVDGLGEDVKKVRDDFEHNGWKTYLGPSKWW